MFHLKGYTFDGLQLKNRRFDCFMNTAINTVVTNVKLMEELVNVEPLKMWGLKLLLGHSSKFDGNRENSYRDILMGLNVLESDPVGCTDIHEELCFTRQRNQIK